MCPTRGNLPKRGVSGQQFSLVPIQFGCIRFGKHVHFQDDVAVNLLTIDATDPKSGTAEFKATAIRIDKLQAAVSA